MLIKVPISQIKANAKDITGTNISKIADDFSKLQVSFSDDAYKNITHKNNKISNFVPKKQPMSEKRFINSKGAIKIYGTKLYDDKVNNILNLSFFPKHCARQSKKQVEINQKIMIASIEIIMEKMYLNSAKNP